MQQAPEMDKGLTPVLAGTVVNSNGQPPLGATVWVIGGTYESSAKITASQTTDAGGRFAFAEVKLPDANTPRLRRPQLIARDKQGRLGWSQYFYPGYLPKLDVKLKLQEVSPCGARVVDATGQPITGAEIVPLYWNSAVFARLSSSAILSMCPRNWRRRIRPRPTARVVLFFRVSPPRAA
jgi:hypothetical protein